MKWYSHGRLVTSSRVYQRIPVLARNIYGRIRNTGAQYVRPRLLKKIWRPQKFVGKPWARSITFSPVFCRICNSFCLNILNMGHEILNLFLTCPSPWLYCSIGAWRRVWGHTGVIPLIHKQWRTMQNFENVECWLHQDPLYTSESFGGFISFSVIGFLACVCSKKFFGKRSPTCNYLSTCIAKLVY